MIKSSHFFTLLDCLAGQFFNTRSALCVGSDFGEQIYSKARDFFSIAVVSRKLPHDLLVFGALVKNAIYDKSVNGCTYTIYIDTSKIKGDFFRDISSIILAHEICHFAFYYELFLTLDGTTETEEEKLDKFISIVSGSLLNAVEGQKEQNRLSQTIFDEHNTADLVKLVSLYPMEHFARGQESNIFYRSFFLDFIDHMQSEADKNPPAYEKSPELLPKTENALETEWKFYQDNRDKLVKEYCNKYIVISGNEIVSAYDDEETAFEETIKTIPPGSFMIHHVAAEEEVYYLSPYINV